MQTKQMTQLSGLELLRLISGGQLPSPPMAEVIPMNLVRVDAGDIEFEAVADRRHLNPMGGVHGGFAATVLDSATGVAVHSMLGPGQSYGTIDLNVKLVKPLPLGRTLFAPAKVIKMTKRLGISEARLIDDEGNIYAHATATCMIVDDAGAQ